MYTLIAEGETPSAVMDVSGLTDNLQLSSFTGVIEALLPIVATAVIVGFLVYIVRWTIRLFRGI